jgi:hypothetical protein
VMECGECGGKRRMRIVLLKELGECSGKVRIVGEEGEQGVGIGGICEELIDGDGGGGRVRARRGAGGKAG